MKHFKEFIQWCCEPQRLFVLFIVVLAIPNVALFFTEQQMTLWARICNVILPVSVYWLIMTLERKPGKTIWILFPFVFFAAFQLVLLYLFGRSIIAVDMFLNLTTTNSGEALELLDNLLPAVIGVFVVYIPALVLGGFSWARGNQLEYSFIRSQRKYALAGIVAGALLTVICYATQRDYQVKIEMYPANVCYNLVLAAERAGETAGYAETSRDFTFNASAAHDENSREVYVLVIGETARACNFGLYGYERNTTPLLDKMEGVVTFTDVLTQSNTTHKSVPMLLSAASAEDYDCLYRQKGIITAFKEAGFHTAFFSNQLPNHSFIDFLGMEADDWKFIKKDAPKGANISDDELLFLVEKELKAGHQKLFIVLHAYGSHFNYKERYPESMSVFKPDNLTDAKYENKEYLMNAYDNTIRYTDGFLASLITLLQKTNSFSAMLYTSDHGEDIFDDSRRLFLHASPVPSYYQIHVPFLLWMSDSYRDHYPSLWENTISNKQKNISSSASFFHTMLELGGVTTPYRNDSLSVVNVLFTEKPRVYLNDHNEARSLNEIGMGEEDFEMLQQKGILYR